MKSGRKVINWLIGVVSVGAVTLSVGHLAQPDQKPAPLTRASVEPDAAGNLTAEWRRYEENDDATVQRAQSARYWSEEEHEGEREWERYDDDDRSSEGFTRSLFHTRTRPS